MAEPVVLVHGLWMNAIALYPLRARLARCGFTAESFGYASVARTPQQNTLQLARFLAQRAEFPPLLVGHSMGGVLILQALKQVPDLGVRRAVLLGSPVAGSAAGRRLSHTAGGRWMLGRSQPLWVEGRIPDAPPGVAVGVIAGSLPIGLGRILTRLPKPHDGVVTLEETRIRGAADSLVMRVNHTGMIFSAEVARQVCAFLKDGRFVRA